MSTCLTLCHCQESAVVVVALELWVTGMFQLSTFPETRKRILEAESFFTFQIVTLASLFPQICYYRRL